MNEELMLGFEIGIIKELFKMELLTEEQMKMAIKTLAESKERRGGKLKEQQPIAGYQPTQTTK